MPAAPSQIVLDHVGDTNGAELHRFAKLYDFPAYVKSASHEETTRPGRLPANAYGDPRVSAFPCHTPASTYLSAVYFAEKQSHYRPKDAARVQGRIQKAAAYFGIVPDVDAVFAASAAVVKSADDRRPDDDFAYCWVDDAGNRHRQWRLATAADCKAAADALYANRDALSYADRNVIAGKILQKAARHGASLGGVEAFVERQAGHGVCDPKEVVAMCRDRALLARRPEERDAMNKLAAMIAGKPSAALLPDMLVKLATTVDGFDAAIGLSGRYTDRIRRPEDVIFKATYKECRAGVGVACPLVTGSVYDKTDFAKLSSEDLRGLFGDGAVDQVMNGLDLDVEKLAELAQTMPRPDAELFEQMLDAAGVPPLTNKYAADDAGLPDELARRLAAAY
jgi:hypothetical protein